MNRVVLGMGSNIDPRRHTAEALNRIGCVHRILAQSAFVETEPIGIKNQPRFLNGAVLIETKMDRDRLREWLRDLETDLGRDRSGPKFGPRTIDLDIVVWNGAVSHKDYWERAYLRRSVREVLPGFDPAIPREERSPWTVEGVENES